MRLSWFPTLKSLPTRVRLVVVIRYAKWTSSSVSAVLYIHATEINRHQVKKALHAYPISEAELASETTSWTVSSSSASWSQMKRNAGVPNLKRRADVDPFCWQT